MTKSISLYNKPWEVKSQDTIPIDLFFENIQNGLWQDIVLPIRAQQDPDVQDKMKKAAPSVTMSGLFNVREDDQIKDHSGLIAIDVDEKGLPNNMDVEMCKSLVCADNYVYAAFSSIRGKGVCIVVKINPSKHREAFYGLSEYLYSNYKIIVDPTSVNPSRARFVSFDPDIYINENSEKFAQYPKYKPPKKIDKVIYVSEDFSNILNQIISGHVNITQDSYHIWIRLAFSIASKFGEQGRQYFHCISQYSSKYDAEVCDKQFTACVKHNQQAHVASPVTISTLYFYARQSGVDIYSERTKKIAYSASSGKKSGLNPVQIATNLEKFEEITGGDVIDIINQVIQAGIDINEDGLLDKLELWMKQTYILRRNEITRYIESDSGTLQKKDLNSIYIKAKKIFDGLSFELVDRLIDSDFVPSYNPLLQFFQKHSPEYTSSPDQTPCIDKLFNCIDSGNKEWVLYFGKKWMVGCIASAFGETNPLMPVLQGEKQNTGKTQWWRRMFPPELKIYYAESKLDAGKDDEILMCQKWVIMDDEMSGKSKKEHLRLNTLTSKDWFSLREPYGRGNVDLKRLANLGGTTNDPGILTDVFGNRRIVPIHVESIDFGIYNSISKIELWVEAYKLYKSGFAWELTNDDIKYLGIDADRYEVLNAENELIQRYFEPDGSYEMTATDVKVYIEKHTNQRLSLDRVGKELNRLGYDQKFAKERIEGKRQSRRFYLVNYRMGSGVGQPPIPGANGAGLDGWKPFERDDADRPF